MPTTAVLAYLAAALIGYLGYRVRALTTSGAVAACMVGGTIFGVGGLAWAVLLILFFVSSSGLSFVKASDARKQQAAETFEKGGTRDAAQVLANGGAAAFVALLSLFVGDDTLSLLFGAYVGALATAAADTWATEIGVLSKRQPRLITTGKRVAPGTSGGVTWLGSAAGIAGSLVIGAAAAALAMLPGPFGLPVASAMGLLPAGLLGGVAGSMADSVLGATVQASYWCPRCDKPTEGRVHKCGTRTRLVRGVAPVDNDVVNFVATLVGATVGGLVGLLS